MKSKKKNKIKKSEYLKVEIGKSYSFQTRDNKIKKYLIFIIMLMGFFASAFLIYKLFIKKEASIPFIKPEEKEEL